MPSVLSCVLTACEFTATVHQAAPEPAIAGPDQPPLAGAGAGGAASVAPPRVSLGTEEPPGPAAAPAHYEAFGPIAAPDVAVYAMRLSTKPEPDGAVFADLEDDDSATDDFDPEVPVIFQAEGYGEQLVAPNAKLSVRGKSTRFATLKSYRIELDKGEPLFRGQQDILLNKHPYDHSRLRNKLALDLFQALPELQSPMATFATLVVDGEDLGFYTQVGRVDKRFLARRSLDQAGSLYKAEFFEFNRYPQALMTSDAEGYDEALFEKHLEIYGSRDHRKLIAMLDAVNDPNIPINATIDMHFDRANYVTWLALQAVCDNLDTSSQNFFLYHPAGEGTWRFLPWDYDGALGYYDQDARAFLARWQEGPANWWGVTLHRRFMKDAENVRQLVARIDELADRFFTRERVDTYLREYVPIVSAHVLDGVDLEHYGLAQRDAPRAFQTAVQRIPTVFSAARNRFKTAMKRPMPIFLGTPRRAERGVRFSWDASFDLQGDSISYDFVVARDPRLADKVAERKGLTATNAVIEIPSGVYFYTVTIRDASGEWQIPFSRYVEGDMRYPGVLRFEVP